MLNAEHDQTRTGTYRPAAETSCKTLVIGLLSNKRKVTTTLLRSQCMSNKDNGDYCVAKFAVVFNEKKGGCCFAKFAILSMKTTVTATLLSLQ